MSERQPMIPRPEVQHLPTVFRRLTTGEVRVPAFQRGFVWESRQVIELLESIVKGYPIGSLLFWRLDAPGGFDVATVDERSEFETSAPVPFPHIDLEYPCSFVLDGMQRLSALYGVFYASDRDDVYNVGYDLRHREFVFITGDALFDDEGVLPLRSLFSPRLLIAAQQQMATLEDGERLIDMSIELLSSFQDYLLPIVTITSKELAEVVEIFERVNNTGTRLSRVHFMRALTWSSGFDLNDALEVLTSEFASDGFLFASETLIKVIAIQMGKSPNADSMLDLRKCTAEQLADGAESARRALRRVIEFLRSECGVFASDFVPYEGQVLVLAAVFGTVADPPESLLRAVKRWYWSVSLSEALRGKPDSYVTREIRNAQGLINGDPRAMDRKLFLEPDTFLERRFTRRKALSSAVVGMFAVQKARDLASGDELRPHDFLTEFRAENFVSICSVESIQGLANRYAYGSSARILANLCVVPNGYDVAPVARGAKDLILSIGDRVWTAEANRVLASQFISGSAFDALKAGDEREFLRLRSVTMYEAALRLTSSAAPQASFDFR